MHTNKVNKKKYIGITSQIPNKRWREGKGYHDGCFRYAIDKYGWDNFEHEIIEKDLTFEDAKIKEKHYISIYNTKAPNGYNLTDGGEGTANWIASQEFRDKQSIIQKERWTDTYKHQISVQRKSPNSVYQSNEFRKKISDLVSGENNPNFGNKWSKEQKEALSQKQKKNPIYFNENNPNAKRIMCVETGEIFECIKYAKEKYGIKSDGSLTVALKNPTRTAAKMHWVYL